MQEWLQTYHSQCIPRTLSQSRDGACDLDTITYVSDKDSRQPPLWRFWPASHQIPTPLRLNLCQLRGMLACPIRKAVNPAIWAQRAPVWTNSGIFGGAGFTSWIIFIFNQLQASRPFLIQLIPLQNPCQHEHHTQLAARPAG